MLHLTGVERAEIEGIVRTALAGRFQANDLEKLAKDAIDFCQNACNKVLASRGRIDYLARQFVERAEDLQIDTAVIALAISRLKSILEAKTGRDGPLFRGRIRTFIGSVIEKLMTEVAARQIESAGEMRELKGQIQAMKLNAIKFTTKRNRGWIDVGGSRMFLLDISGGWYNLVERIMLFAGSETSRRVLFDAGKAETFTTKALKQGVFTMSPQGFIEAVDTLSEAGFGDFRVEELRFDEAYATITCTDAFEGWAYLQEGRASDVPVCHFSAGALLSFMQNTSGNHDLISTETKCVARGDDHCEFIVGKRDALEKQGICMPQWGMTIKERAESLENLLAEKEQAEKQIRKRNAELNALNKIATAVSQSLDLKEIARLAVKELRKIVGDKGVVIYLLDAFKQELSVASHDGFSDEFVNAVSKLSLGEGLTGNVAYMGVPSAYDDYRSYPKAIEVAVKEEKLSSLLAVPLKAKSQIVGVLTVASKTPYHFTEDEINLLTMIGNQIGVVTDNAMLHRGLKESERKYKRLVEDINDGYFVCQNDRIVFANDAFFAMHGYDGDETLGRDYRDFVAPECVKDVQQMVMSQMSGESRLENVEFLRNHKDGRKLPTEAKIVVSEFEGRQAIIGMSRDISERKRLEQKVLENERLASIGELSSTLAHEIRNPLSAIKMTIQILSKNLKVEGFDKKRFDIALTEIRRLDRFLQDMLHFARPVTMSKSPNSLSDIVAECLFLLEDKARSRNIQISLDKSQAKRKALLDFSKMEEVFLNILLNSMDAMPKGGEIHVTVTDVAAPSGQMVQVQIEDTGIGIPKEQLSRIYEPFFSTKTEGAGLGLSNVKRIVEAHSGSIEVESQMNVGTTFTIQIPAE